MSEQEKLEAFAEVESGKYHCSPKLVVNLIRDWEAQQSKKKKGKK